MRLSASRRSLGDVDLSARHHEGMVSDSIESAIRDLREVISEETHQLRATLTEKLKAAKASAFDEARDIVQSLRHRDYASADDRPLDEILKLLSERVAGVPVPLCPHCKNARKAAFEEVDAEWVRLMDHQWVDNHSRYAALGAFRVWMMKKLGHQLCSHPKGIGECGKPLPCAEHPECTCPKGFAPASRWLSPSGNIGVWFGPLEDGLNHREDCPKAKAYIQSRVLVP